MPHTVNAGDEIGAAVARLPAGPLLLAVSGGRDSMVLLHAVAARRRSGVTVATFDHGTGPAATRAANLAARLAARSGLVCVRGTGTAARSEDALRRERWSFLRRVATELGARIVTAHSRDDQVETVFIRLLRDTGVRGMAAMYAPDPGDRIVRPFLDIPRAAIAGWAAAHRVKWVEDPSNARLHFLRNRVRHEILPAIERVRPGFAEGLLALARRAAAWRQDVSLVVDALIGSGEGSALDWAGVPAAALAGLTPDALAIVWPEILGRVGVAVDWRGLERLVSQSPNLKPGGEIPLSGGVTVRRTVTSFTVRVPGPSAPLY